MSIHNYNLTNPFEKSVLALKSINGFLKVGGRPEIGYFVMGEIFYYMNDYELALMCFNKSKEFEESAKVNYRIGKIKEENTDLSGIFEIYLATIEGKHNFFLLQELRKYAKNRSIVLECDDDNEFIDKFNSHDHLGFWLSREIDYSDKAQMQELEYFMDVLRKSRAKFEFAADKVVVTQSSDKKTRKGFIQNEANSLNITDDNPYYNDNLDFDQQSPEFWDET